MINTEICLQIAEHIAKQNNQEDTLEGIILGIYENQIATLAQEVTKALGEMTRAQIVEEKETTDAIVYQLNVAYKQVLSHLKLIKQND